MIGQVLRAVPGLLAKQQAGQNVAEQESYKRKREQEELDRKAEERAFEEFIRSEENRRSNTFSDRGGKLVDAQLGLYGAQKEDELARARGTGYYAPKPVAPQRPRYQILDTPTGGKTRYNLDDPTDQVPIPGAGRPQSSGGGGIGGALQNKAAGMSSAADAAFNEMIDLAPNGAPKFKMQRTVGGMMTDILTPGGNFNDDLSKGILSRAMGSVGFAGGQKNLAQDRAAFQAGSRFVGQWLQAVSGAAFTDQEYQRYLIQIMPSTNDDPIFREQKLRTWVALRDALRIAGGRYDPNEVISAEERKRRKEEAMALFEQIRDGGGAPPSAPPAPVTGTDADIPDSSQVFEDFLEAIGREPPKPGAVVTGRQFKRNP